MDYAFTPATPVVVPVVASTAVFPVRRVYCVGQNYAEHVAEILPDEMRQHEAVVQLGAPAHALAVQRRGPVARDQRPHQQLLADTKSRINACWNNQRFVVNYNAFC